MITTNQLFDELLTKSGFVVIYNLEVKHNFVVHNSINSLVAKGHFLLSKDFEQNRKAYKKSWFNSTKNPRQAFANNRYLVNKFNDLIKNQQINKQSNKPNNYTSNEHNNNGLDNKLNNGLDNESSYFVNNQYSDATSNIKQEVFLKDWYLKSYAQDFNYQKSLELHQRVHNLHRQLDYFNFLYWSHNYQGFCQNYKASNSEFINATISNDIAFLQSVDFNQTFKLTNVITTKELKKYSLEQFVDLYQHLDGNLGSSTNSANQLVTKLSDIHNKKLMSITHKLFCDVNYDFTNSTKPIEEKLQSKLAFHPNTTSNTIIAGKQQVNNFSLLSELLINYNNLIQLKYQEGNSNQLHNIEIRQAKEKILDSFKEFYDLLDNRQQKLFINPKALESHDRLLVISAEVKNALSKVEQQLQEFEGFAQYTFEQINTQPQTTHVSHLAEFKKSQTLKDKLDKLKDQILKLQVVFENTLIKQIEYFTEHQELVACLVNVQLQVNNEQLSQQVISLTQINYQLELLLTTWNQIQVELTQIYHNLLNLVISHLYNNSQLDVLTLNKLTLDKLTIDKLDSDIAYLTKKYSNLNKQLDIQKNLLSVQFYKAFANQQTHKQKLQQSWANTQDKQQALNSITDDELANALRADLNKSTYNSNYSSNYNSAYNNAGYNLQTNEYQIVKWEINNYKKLVSNLIKELNYPFTSALDYSYSLPKLYTLPMGNFAFKYPNALICGLKPTTNISEFQNSHKQVLMVNKAKVFDHLMSLKIDFKSLKDYIGYLISVGRKPTVVYIEDFVCFLINSLDIINNNNNIKAEHSFEQQESYLYDFSLWKNQLYSHLQKLLLLTNSNNHLEDRHLENSHLEDRQDSIENIHSIIKSLSSRVKEFIQIYYLNARNFINQIINLYDLLEQFAQEQEIKIIANFNLLSLVQAVGLTMQDLWSALDGQANSQIKLAYVNDNLETFTTLENYQKYLHAIGVDVNKNLLLINQSLEQYQQSLKVDFKQNISKLKELSISKQESPQDKNNINNSYKIKHLVSFTRLAEHDRTNKFVKSDNSLHSPLSKLNEYHDFGVNNDFSYQVDNIKDKISNQRRFSNISTKIEQKNNSSQDNLSESYKPKRLKSFASKSTSQPQDLPKELVTKAINNSNWTDNFSFFKEMGLYSYCLDYIWEYNHTNYYLVLNNILDTSYCKRLQQYYTYGLYKWASCQIKLQATMNSKPAQNLLMQYFYLTSHLDLYKL